MIRPDAQKKDTLFCAGVLDTVGPLKKSKTEDSPYYMEEIKIKGLNGAPSAKFNLMWAPQFFDPTYRSKSFAESICKKTDSVDFVFSKNLVTASGSNSLGYLEGLCGSPDSFIEFDNLTKSLDTFDPETVHELIRGFLTELGPVPFIYVLKQERKAAGVDPETGKKVYVRGNFYEVDSIAYLTEKSVKGFIKGLEANTKNRAKADEDGKDVPVAVKFKFDPADYGIEVEVPGLEPAWVG